MNIQKLEEELGVSLEVFIKALKKGIWVREKLELPNKYFRQESPYHVMPYYDEDEGCWMFKYNPRAYGNNDGYDAHIFYDYVRLYKFRDTWGLTKSYYKTKNK